MSQELKPCLFCGGEAKVQSHFTNSMDSSRSKTVFAVECQKCFASTSQYSETKEEAIKAWNTRQLEELDEDKVRNLLDELGRSSVDRTVYLKSERERAAKAICQRFGSKKCEVDKELIKEIKFLKSVFEDKREVVLNINDFHWDSIDKAIKQAHDERKL